MRKLNYARKKLADGFEDDILKQNFEIQVNGEKMEFSLKQFYNNSFNELNDFQDKKSEIAKNENFNTSKFDGSYQSSDNLEILYTKKGNLLALFSYGEFQPARYQLYLEGIYSLK